MGGKDGKNERGQAYDHMQETRYLLSPFLRNLLRNKKETGKE